MSNDLPTSSASSAMVPTAPTTTHVYSTSRSDTFRFALRLRSFASESHATPLFLEGTTIEGSVELDLSKRSRVTSIILTVRGFERRSVPQAVYMSVEETSNPQDNTFLEQTVTLWSAPSASNAFLDAGRFSLPFQETLPLMLATSRGPIPLPPTFSPDNCPIFVLYEISAVVRRGGLLQRDETLLTPFRYIRRSQSAPDNPRRLGGDDRLASPQTDPSAWSTQAVSLQGNVSGRVAEVVCQVSVPTPTSYPRGHPIPVWVTVRARDRQVLTMFASGARVHISLDRVLSWTASSNFAGSAPTDEIHAVAAARLSQVSNVSEVSNTAMHLHGEVLPPSNLPASFVAPSFHLGYILSFSVHGTHFSVPGARRGAPALTLPISITASTHNFRSRYTGAPARSSDTLNTVTSTRRRFVG